MEDLQKRVDLLEKADNINNLKFLREKLVGRVYGDDDTATTLTVNFVVNTMTGAGSVDVLDFPDGFLEIIKADGQRVRLPYYSLSRF